MAMILVVDDERTICDLLQRVFTHHGYEVLTASGGREALELFQQHRPQVILLDLHMPEMDGITVLQHIRAIDPQAVVMILTGWLEEGLEHQARALGVGGIFLKTGFALDELVRTVDRVTEHTTTLPEPASPLTDALATTESKMLILVVDDEPVIQDVLTQFLTLRGYRVRVAWNGAETLALVEQERPQLIILDIYMPGMNGVEVLRELRIKKKYTGGVIVLTACQDEALLQRVRKLGPLSVLIKPIDLARLAVPINTALAFYMGH